MVLVVALLAQQSLADLEVAVKRQPNAANYRRVADAYVAAGKYQAASEAFAEASGRYAKLGDPNAAKVLDTFARRYRTEIRLFAEVATNAADAATNFTGARHEPLFGCYLGANVERDDVTRDPAKFNEIVGKHAMFFMYRRYGVEFPSEQARILRRIGAGIQIAFEPSSVEEVRDDAYLRKFADDARRSGIPVFLRFASEMNGDWVPYGRDPAAYRSMFRLVSRVVREIAPNVAMVWCPNETPEAKIAAMYPGADAVDWVGVNFYSVLYNDGDRSRGAEWRHPIDAVDFVYRTYSSAHPIMVGEWAATHASVLDRAPRPDFARTKIAQFYSALPLLYPRVKAVNWLSMNTMTHARPGRQLNNFCLLDDASVAESYRAATSASHFLRETPSSRQSAPTQWVPIGASSRVPHGTHIAAFIRSYEPNPQVVIGIDGRTVQDDRSIGWHEITLPERRGRLKLTYEIRDSAGRTALKRETVVETQ